MKSIQIDHVHLIWSELVFLLATVRQRDRFRTVWLTLPVMVVLVDDRDAAWVQVDPQEVRPDPHGALQLVGLQDSIQAAVHRVRAQHICQQEGLRCVRDEREAVFDHISVTDRTETLQECFAYLRT